MPNTYFEFKQFRIDQEHCAMKVCTDGCILGAWYASKIKGGDILRLQETQNGGILRLHDDYHCGRILDLGSGTGLLMMMLAQVSSSFMDGIEIGNNCYEQLVSNISRSKWAHRLTAIQGDARTYPFPHKYDFIISNPPFYENDLKSGDQNRQIAMHSNSLNLVDLVKILKGNLSATGIAGIMLPAHRAKTFEALAADEGFYCIEELLIKQTPGHDYFRAITSYTFSRPDLIRRNTLTIKDEANQYTPGFRELLAPYYLNLES